MFHSILVLNVPYLNGNRIIPSLRGSKTVHFHFPFVIIGLFPSTDHFRSQTHVGVKKTKTNKNLTFSLRVVCIKVRWNQQQQQQQQNPEWCPVGIQLILLACLKTFYLTSGKQFLHKLKIIQCKICKYIRTDKERGGAVVCFQVKKNWTRALKLNREKNLKFFL